MKRLLLACLLLTTGLAQAQEDTLKKWELGGYVKFLQISTFFDDSGSPVPLSPLTNTFFHNRINLAWYPAPQLKLVGEMRNRLFYGEQVKSTPGFGRSIDQQPGLFDASVRWWDGNGVVLHSVFDRLYVNYATEKWDVRLGRQRINWGLNLIWNPNDLFNALNFLDFDYEERPGTDALRIQRYTGILSKVELAFAPDDTLDQSIGALLYKTNWRGTDLQGMAGYYRGDLALGLGWEGSIGGAGFKGEGTWFVPMEASPDSSQTLVGSMTIDYLFGNGVYMAGAFLYNSQGNNQSGISQNGLFTGQPSAKNLFPATWAFALNGSGSISPLFSVSAAAIYSPSNHLTVVAPTLTYSIVENWDLDAIAQALLLSNGSEYGHAGTSFFFRVRWSY